MKSVKEAAQQVLKEEDCSRNCIILRLVEEPVEGTSSVFSVVMESIGIKPKIQAVRIEVQKNEAADNRPKHRPLKFSHPSLTHVVRILNEKFEGL